MAWASDIAEDAADVIAEFGEEITYTKAGGAAARTVRAVVMRKPVLPDTIGPITTGKNVAVVLVSSHPEHGIGQVKERFDTVGIRQSLATLADPDTLPDGVEPVHQDEVTMTVLKIMEQNIGFWKLLVQA